MMIDNSPETSRDAALARLYQLFSDSEMMVVSRHANLAIWSATAEMLQYMPVAYSSSMIDYQISYFAGAGKDIVDASVVIYFNNKPCAIWPLSITVGPSEVLGSNGADIIPPLFIKNFSSKSLKSVVTSCLDIVEQFSRRHNTVNWNSLESFTNQAGLSDWHDFSMKRGARAFLRHELFVDMSLDLSVIKSRMRKSYKSLVTSGSKLWKVDILSKDDKAAWEEFYLLHVQVAGRVTRSKESWDQQFKAIQYDSAFLVTLRDDAFRMVGAGLFYVTRDEGLYAVGAYDRDLFDKPLGHVVQFRAIEEMKLRGVNWYKIGARPYLAELPVPSDKEMQIADFKQGFATHVLPTYGINYEE